MDVALTVDDLPRHGQGESPVAIADALLASFRRHGLGSVTGFVNVGKLDQHPEDRAVLEAWRAAGHPLANHQWSHADLHVVSPDEYIDGIARSEALLAALGTPPHTKYFRYPFLREGKTADERARVRGHLDGHGYRVAQVTIDPWDWAYDAAYVRCGRQADRARQATLREAFLREAEAKLQWSRAAATRVAGRPVKHILLVHLGALDADVIDDLLSAYERDGVRWVTLEEATTDPIYDERIEAPGGGQFLAQLARQKHVELPPTPSPPQALIDDACR